MEQVVAAAAGPKWFQLYASPDPAKIEALIARAEAAGFAALVLNVDVPVRLRFRRLTDVRAF